MCCFKHIRDSVHFWQLLKSPRPETTRHSIFSVLSLLDISFIFNRCHRTGGDTCKIWRWFNRSNRYFVKAEMWIKRTFQRTELKWPHRRCFLSWVTSLERDISGWYFLTHIQVSNLEHHRLGVHTRREFSKNTSSHSNDWWISLTKHRKRWNAITPSWQIRIQEITTILVNGKIG